MFGETSIGIIVAFFVGSIPFGWIIAKLWGVSDLRAVGSSNIGATNVVRTAGKLPGALTFLLDAAKSIVPMLYFPEAKIWLGLAAVLGHCFSPFLSFRGGKGVSTTLGALITFSPWLGGASLFSYVLGFGVTGTSALGSLFSMLTTLTGALLFAPLISEKIAVILMVAIVLARHTENWNKQLGSFVNERQRSGAARSGLLFRSMVLLILAGVSITLHTSAASEAKSKTPASVAKPTALTTIQDFRGKHFSISTPARRVVALLPNIAEIIIDLGAGDRLLAAPDYTHLPATLRSKVKNLGPYNHVSAEVIYSTHPDLVLASMDGNEPTKVAQLERLGIRVVTLNSQSLSDITRSMKLIASLLGVKDTAKIDEFESHSKDSVSRTKVKPKVFVQVGWNPIISISKQTFISEVLAAAGGINIFDDSKIKYPRSNAEEVIAQNPDVIVICQLTNSGDEAKQAFDYWKRFTKLSAVKNNRIHILSGDLITRPGFNLLNGLEELRKIL